MWWLGYRAVRGQWRMYQASRKSGGKQTPQMWLYVVLVLTVLWMLTALPQHKPGLFLVLLGVNTVLGLLLAAPAIGRRMEDARVMRKFEEEAKAREDEVSLADQMRERAARLRENEELREARDTAPTANWQSQMPEDPFGDEAAERRRRVEDLFRIACGEPSCLAPTGIPCVLGSAPVAIVDRERILFCHLLRMREAVEAGVADREEVAAQFGAVTEGER